MPQWIPKIPVTVNLRRLFPAASFVGCGDIRTLFATDKSFECRPKSVFAVIRGNKSDGHQYISDAVARGATALLVDHPQATANIAQCIVPDVRRAYAELCAALMAHPARHLEITGVTGTNGKTTITWLIRSILQAAGKQTGLLGTIEYHDGLTCEKSNLTTPDPKSLSQWLCAMVTMGTTHAAMELSSHALDQRRAAGTLLDAAIVSNITQDHFDYHRDFAAYRASKLHIFEQLKETGAAIINVDDAGSRSCLEVAPANRLTYGLEQPADFSATILEETLSGSRFEMQTKTGSQTIRTQLIGRHNVSNCLAAAAVASHMGIAADGIATGIEALKSVPGRMEQIDAGQPFHVFVDFAHTEDALRRCVRFLRRLTPGRVLCVFGAGGDRDRAKRPRLANAASEADIAVVTSDNPRTEDPQSIINDIIPGFAGAARLPHVDADRESAICWALRQAEPGDAVLIAGKGHETEQIIGTERLHFDDREVVRHHLANRNFVLPSPHNLRALQTQVPV